MTRTLLTSIESWQNQPLAPFVFLAIGIPYSLFGLPRQALCLVAGLMFGTLAGFGLAALATLCGTMLGFLWIRRLASSAQRERWQTRFRGRLRLIGIILERSPFQAVLTLRLMPVGSALMVTAAAGLYGVPLGAFCWASFIGAIPQNLVFVLIGAGTQLGQGIQIGLGVMLFAGSSILAWALLTRARREGGALGKLAETTLDDETF
ncbi:TVP38/TMEM64 family protein [Asaia prunellae]|uniref:TVP38/TMEM64 family protein n=1 Tax=Asaia prunellae TaxID=610245 RepID=UPI000472856D|nr:VTT domain-containing protein [Asaia prunellae]